MLGQALPEPLPLLGLCDMASARAILLWLSAKQEKNADDKKPACHADGAHVPVGTGKRAGQEYSGRPGNKCPKPKPDACPCQRQRASRAIRRAIRNESAGTAGDHGKSQCEPRD